MVANVAYDPKDAQVVIVLQEGEIVRVPFEGVQKTLEEASIAS